MKFFIALLPLLLTACLQDGGSDAPAARIADTSPSIVPTTTTTQAPALQVSATYYSVTQTIAPINGWPYKTITLTGHCVTYLAKTYCWDDGIKTIDFTYNHFNYHFDGAYWGLNSLLAPCYGGCNADGMTAPKEVSSTLSQRIGSASVDTGNTVNEVFTQGIAAVVNCTENSGTLNCVDFTIDLNQVAL